jgi:hypothetical protein
MTVPGAIWRLAAARRRRAWFIQPGRQLLTRRGGRSRAQTGAPGSQRAGAATRGPSRASAWGMSPTFSTLR